VTCGPPIERRHLFAGLLGCLAVLATGLSAVQAAAPIQTTASEPCDHCPDCKGVPCAPALASCPATCVAPSPALGPAAIAVPSIAAAVVPWMATPAVLHGLIDPPDPFPSRS